MVGTVVRTPAGRETDAVAEGSPPPAIWPTLRARDARALIAFLIEAFGFVEVVLYGDGEWVDHAELAWPPGGGIMIGSVRADDDGDDATQVHGPISTYAVAADPDALCARATAAGADVTVPIHDTAYGSREFSARDLEGNRWTFGTYAGATRGS